MTEQLITHASTVPKPCRVRHTGAVLHRSSISVLIPRPDALDLRFLPIPPVSDWGLRRIADARGLVIVFAGVDDVPAVILYSVACSSPITKNCLESFGP